MVEAEKNRSRFKWQALALSAGGFGLVYWAWPLPDSRQAIVAATLVAVVVLWVSEAFPLYISALAGSFLLLAFGGFSADAVFAPYFDPVIDRKSVV